MGRLKPDNMWKINKKVDELQRRIFESRSEEQLKLDSSALKRRRSMERLSENNQYYLQMVKNVAIEMQNPLSSLSMLPSLSNDSIRYVEEKTGDVELVNILKDINDGIKIFCKPSKDGDNLNIKFIDHFPLAVDSEYSKYFYKSHVIEEGEIVKSNLGRSIFGNILYTDKSINRFSFITKFVWGLFKREEYIKELKINIKQLKENYDRESRLG